LELEKEVKKVILCPQTQVYNPFFEGFDDEKIVRSCPQSTVIYHRDTGVAENIINTANYASCANFDDGRLVLGCSNGGIIYKYFGGSNFYWNGLGSGKTLGTVQKEEKMDLIE